MSTTATTALQEGTGTDYVWKGRRMSDLEPKSNPKMGFTSSQSIAELSAALSKAQGEMEGAKKDSANPFFKSKYADLASCWECCREPLAKNGLSVIQLPSAEGTRLFVTTVLSHSSGEWISGTLSMESKDGSPQAIGSAITYARRYALSAIVGIAPEDDDGNAAQGREKKPLHQEGLEHPADACQVCLAAGVPEGYAVVENHGHYYIRRLSDKKTPTHDYEHNSWKYCPGCAKEWNKLSEKERQAFKVPAVPPSAAAAPAGATQEQGAAISDAAPKSSATTPDRAESAGRESTATGSMTAPTKGQQALSDILAGDAERKASKPITPQQRNALTKRAAELGWQDADFLGALRKFGVDRPHDILAVDYKRVCDFIETGGTLL